MYLFKAHARQKMLSFKKILSSEFPLRMLPLDYMDIIQEDDGFDVIVQKPSTMSNQDSTASSMKASKRD